MSIDNARGRLSLTENALIITNAFTGKRLTIAQSYDFMLYIGDRADMREFPSADFVLKERAENNMLVREYTQGGLSVFVTYESEEETFVKRVRVKSETPVKLCKICVLGGGSSLAVSRGGEGQRYFSTGHFGAEWNFPRRSTVMKKIRCILLKRLTKVRKVLRVFPWCSAWIRAAISKARLTAISKNTRLQNTA